MSPRAEIAITRRRALRWLAATSLAGLIPVSTQCSDAAPTPPDVPEELARLGRAYLAKHPEQADLAKLEASLPDDWRFAGDAPPADLGARVREDFEQGRIHLLGGWMLSDTELKLAAWLALVS